MSDPYASPTMIRRITQRRYRPAQRRALKALGIPFIQARDGSPLVLLQNLPDHQARGHHDNEPRFHEL